MTFKSIIDLNAVAVKLIHQQDYAYAIKTSAKALRLQKLSQPEQSPVPSMRIRDGFLDQCMLRSTTNDTKTATAHTFIYSHGILLPPTITQDDSLVPAILIFNLALAYQLSAEGQARPAHFLLRAKRLYELAYQSRDVDKNTLFQFAVFNNIAVIEKKVGDKNTAKEYFEYLTAVFIFLVDQGRSELVSQVRGFLVNVPLQDTVAKAA